jgi:hypothetical protein
VPLGGRTHASFLNEAGDVALAQKAPGRSTPGREQWAPVTVGHLWRLIDKNRGAVKIGGSPFKTLAEAEEACKAMLGHLTRLIRND